MKRAKDEPKTGFNLRKSQTRKPLNQSTSPVHLKKLPGGSVEGFYGGIVGPDGDDERWSCLQSGVPRPELAFAYTPPSCLLCHDFHDCIPPEAVIRAIGGFDSYPTPYWT